MAQNLRSLLVRPIRAGLLPTFQPLRPVPTAASICLAPGKPARGMPNVAPCSITLGRADGHRTACLIRSSVPDAASGSRPQALGSTGRHVKQALELPMIDGIARLQLFAALGSWTAHSAVSGTALRKTWTAIQGLVALPPVRLEAGNAFCAMPCLPTYNTPLATPLCAAATPWPVESLSASPENGPAVRLLVLSLAAAPIGLRRVIRGPTSLVLFAGAPLANPQTLERQPRDRPCQLLRLRLCPLESATASLASGLLLLAHSCSKEEDGGLGRWLMLLLPRPVLARVAGGKPAS